MSEYQLINELCESKVFRSKQATSKFSKSEKADLLYATLLSVIAGSLDTTTAAWAREYAGKTAAFSNFDHFRPSATDLYVLLHMANLGAETSRMVNFLKKVSRGNPTQSDIQQVLLRMERKLPGVDARLRSARRTVANWGSTSPAARKNAIQNIVLVTRSITRRSEVLPYMKVLKGGPKGSFGKSSALKKAAALAGIGLAGLALGYKTYDPNKRFSFSKVRNSIELDSGNMLAEDRATQLAYIAQKLPEHPAVEKVISVNYLADGISAFVRTKDGNAYEFEIRPARFAKGHEDKRGVTEDVETQPCEWCNATGVDEWGDTCFSCGGLGEVTMDGEYAGVDEDLWEYKVVEIDDFDDENPLKQ